MRDPLRNAGKSAKIYRSVIAWGDTDDLVKIHVDGCLFDITSGLHGALKMLRRKTESVMLWVDAICINQRDKAEQSQQVELMAGIYSEAESVAVWLGPTFEASDLAIKLLQAITSEGNSAKDLILSDTWRPHFTALVSLFEREYWSRLWVVQEVLNAKSVVVHCGRSALPWEIYEDASGVLANHTSSLRHHFPSGMTKGSRQRVSYAHILTSQGPASFDVLRLLRNMEEQSLLEILRTCRVKLASEPRDKVFGVLGILPEHVRYHFPPNYNSSLREVYTNVVDFLLHTTHRLDVIREAVYFPLYTSTINLPTWVPDWSHIAQTAALGLSYGYSAASKVDAEFSFLDPPQRTKLEITAVYLDTVQVRGIAVGTFCGLDDALMAFLHWRAKLLAHLNEQDQDIETQRKRDESFCRTICLGQPAAWGDPRDWMRVCFHVFATLIRERLSYIQLDEQLQWYAGKKMADVAAGERRSILQDNCASRIMGRCFFITDGGLMGIGTGFMEIGDVMCVPLGCSTPVLLRPEGRQGEYRFVGDAYVDGYMDGKAVKEWDEGRRKTRKYVLH